MAFVHRSFSKQISFFSDAAPTFQYAFIDQTVQPGEFLNIFFLILFPNVLFNFEMITFIRAESGTLRLW
jgi:hypothetical protein